MEPLASIPTLEVTDPDGQPYQTLALKEDRLTIGRIAVYNDLALEPDPQQLISRKGYCALEHDAPGWWVVDNGTFLQHDGHVQMVPGTGAPDAPGSHSWAAGPLRELGQHPQAPGGRERALLGHVYVAYQLGDLSLPGSQKKWARPPVRISSSDRIELS
jgi:hypothetical protein